MNAKNILVLCTGNSCQSQMAEGYLKHFAGTGYTVYSAGIEAHGVNPRAVAVLAEDGIDISGHTSNVIDDFNGVVFDYVITVCDNAKENCPYFPGGGKRFHQNFPDPAKATGAEPAILDEFRKVRDMIKSYCEEFSNTELFSH